MTVLEKVKKTSLEEADIKLEEGNELPRYTKALLQFDTLDRELFEVLFDFFYNNTSGEPCFCESRKVIAGKIGREWSRELGSQISRSLKKMATKLGLFIKRERKKGNKSNDSSKICPSDLLTTIIRLTKTVNTTPSRVVTQQVTRGGGDSTSHQGVVTPQVTVRHKTNISIRNKNIENKNSCSSNSNIYSAKISVSEQEGKVSEGQKTAPAPTALSSQHKKAKPSERKDEFDMLFEKVGNKLAVELDKPFFDEFDEFEDDTVKATPKKKAKKDKKPTPRHKRPNMSTKIPKKPKTTSPDLQNAVFELSDSLKDVIIHGKSKLSVVKPSKIVILDESQKETVSALLGRARSLKS